LGNLVKVSNRASQVLVSPVGNSNGFPEAWGGWLEIQTGCRFFSTGALIISTGGLEIQTGWLN
jgi:hypothetical protein